MYLPLAALSVLGVLALRELVERLRSRLLPARTLSKTWRYAAWAIPVVLIATLITAAVDRNREYVSGGRPARLITRWRWS
jgi:hypothetical protein